MESIREQHACKPDSATTHPCSRCCGKPSVGLGFHRLSTGVCVSSACYLLFLTLCGQKSCQCRRSLARECACACACACARFSLSQSESPQPLRTAIISQYPNHDHVFVPLINLSPDERQDGGRRELQLRLDALEILQMLEVHPDQLVYARGSGEVSCAPALNTLHDQGLLRLILVDHNAYSGVCRLLFVPQTRNPLHYLDLQLLGCCNGGRYTRWQRPYIRLCRRSYRGSPQRLRPTRRVRAAKLPRHSHGWQCMQFNC